MRRSSQPARFATFARLLWLVAATRSWASERSLRLYLFAGLSLGWGLTLQVVAVQAAAITAGGAEFLAALHQCSSTARIHAAHLQAQADYYRHLHATACQVAPGTSVAPSNWPTADLDMFTATDLEELMSFAADIFEFLQQEYALFMCAFGESHAWGCAMGAAALTYRLFRVLSNRRFK